MMHNVLSRKRWGRIQRRRKLAKHRLGPAGINYDTDRKVRRIAILRKQRQLAAVRA